MTARRLLVATGLRDVLPDVPGLAARWGIDVLHCPYCHGWEVRDQRIGILSTGPAAVHQALLFQQLSPHVTLLRHTGPALDAEQRALLEALGVAIADGVVEQVETGARGLTGVVLAGRGHLALDAVVVAPRLEARAELLEPLGLKPVEVLIGEHPVGTRIEADRTGATAVPGVWVAGNLTDPQAQVIAAAAAGLTAGAAINLKIGGVDVLANADGLTLYWFAPDTTTSSKCFGSCAIYWPPVSGSPAAGPGVTGKLGTIKRPGGGLQATYDGHPLYTYIGDRGPGQANGNDLDLNGGFWYDIRVSR